MKRLILKNEEYDFNTDVKVSINKFENNYIIIEITSLINIKMVLRREAALMLANGILNEFSN